MPRNKKPRKKFTCRRIEIPRISEERIDVIIDTMTNVGFSVELKLPYGRFDRDDMRALADFSNLTGVKEYKPLERKWTDVKLISLLEEHAALKGRGEFAPTKILAKQHNLSESQIKRLLTQARAIDKN